MAPVYNTLKHGPDSLPMPDSIQASPDIILFAVPFSIKNTYNFDPEKSGDGKVGGTDSAGALMVEGPVVIPGVLNVSVTTSKRSHVSNLSAQLVDPDNTLMYTLAPGDFIFCSMFTNRSDADRVREALAETPPRPINGFHDGLKFMGRVQTVRRTIQTNPMTGAKVRRIHVTAVGFNEFDAAIYFDPALDIKDTDRHLFATKFYGELIENFEKLSTPAGALPALIGSFLGTGPGALAKQVVADAGTQLIVTPNAAFNIPGVVAKLLNVTATDEDRPRVAYADVLTCVFGVQTYSNSFVPIIKPETLDTMRYETLGGKLQGQYSSQIVPWDNVPIWGILQSFLVDAVNEHYTCLRVDAYDRILPHYIARQIPFNTDYLDVPIPITRFTDLPRWKVEDMQVVNYDTCKSNTLRANFVQVRNVAAIGFNHQTEWSRARNLPKYDEADIQRSGLSPVICTTNTLISNFKDEVIWTSVVTDRSMGGHLKYSGQLTTIGIQDPICEGDNLEYDNLIFHIEGVQHSFQINPQNGAASFYTTLILSNGVPANGLPYPEVYDTAGVDAASSQPHTTLE